MHTVSQTLVCVAGEGWVQEEGKPAHKMTPGDVYVVYKAKNPDVQQATVTVIYHDDTDDKNLPGGWTSGEQDEGTPVKYTQDDINKAIEGWKKKHYHYVRTDGTLPTTIPAQDTTVTVHLAHNMIPVNPNTPDKHGVNPDQLTETFTSTLHYQTKEGKQLAPDAVQSSNWIRQVTVDEVTNKVVPDGEYTTKWQLVGNDDRYNNFNVPVEIGYVAGKTTKDGAPVTNIVPGQIKVQRNLEDTVIYDKLAGIIPVDPEGTPIPGVPKTPYKNDPDNQTKVELNQDSTQVPTGWTIEPKDKQPEGVTPDPETNTVKVTPQNSTEPTKAVYKKNTPPTESEVKTSQTVNFVDEEGKKLQPSNVQNGFVFNLKDGKPINGDSHTYNNVDVPKAMLQIRMALLLIIMVHMYQGKR